MFRTLICTIVTLFAVGCAVDEPRPPKKKTGSRLPAEVVPSSAAPAVKAHEPVAVPSNAAVAISLKGIRSDKPQESRERAVNDAIDVARYKIMDELRKLDPPVMAKPTLAKTRNEFLRKDSIREIQPTSEMKEKFARGSIDANRLWVEIDVELTEWQVQQLRAGDRVSDGFRGAGVLLAIAVAAFAFLRIDAWSKGYLTTWLAIAAVVAVVLAAVGLWSARNGLSLIS